MKLDQRAIGALRTLDDAEKEFLLACGWAKAGGGWVHPKLAGPMTRAEAIMATRREILREQIIALNAGTRLRG